MARYALVAFLWLCPALAVAQNASETKAAANALFYEGQRLIATGDVDHACSKFEASLQLLDRLGVRLNLADCHERQGRTATAWTEFLEAASEADKNHDKRAASVRQRADALVPRLAKLAISVPSASQLPGLAVRRDGVTVPNEAFGRPIPVDPGSYTVEASAPGYHVWSTHVDVTKPGQIVTVEISQLAAMATKDAPPKITSARLADAPPKPLAPKAIISAAPTLDLGVSAGNVAPRSSTPSDRVTSPASPQTSSKVVPLVIGVGALALIGSAVGLELWSESKYDAAKSEMMSQPRRESLYNSANTKRYAAEAFAVSGIATCGAAVWLYLRGGNRERDSMTDESVHVVPTTTGVALSGQF